MSKYYKYKIVTNNYEPLLPDDMRQDELAISWLVSNVLHVSLCACHFPSTQNIEFVIGIVFPGQNLHTYLNMFKLFPLFIMMTKKKNPRHFLLKICELIHWENKHVNQLTKKNKLVNVHVNLLQIINKNDFLIACPIMSATQSAP